MQQATVYNVDKIVIVIISELQLGSLANCNLLGSVVNTARKTTAV